MYVYSAQVLLLGCMNRFFFGLSSPFFNTTQSQKYGCSPKQLVRLASELFRPSFFTLAPDLLQELRSSSSRTTSS